MTKKVKASNLFYDILRKNDILKIFGNPGTTEIAFLNGINRHLDFEYILALQESTAVGMAAGYSIGSDKPAFVNLHTFSGLGNGMCNIFNALHNNIPLVITAGQQHRKMLAYDPILSGPLVELVKSSVKSAIQVDHTYDLGIMLQRAINIANKYPKGPSFLSLPMDIFEEQIDYYHDIDVPKQKTNFGSIDFDDLGQIIRLINPKSKICLILDQESHEAFDEIIHLSEILLADVYESAYVNRQVFDTTHFLYKGPISSSLKDQNKLFSKYDIVFVIGGQFCWLLYSEGNPIPIKTKVIHLNNCQKEINHNFRTDLSFVGDINKSIKNLNNLLSKNFKPLDKSKIKYKNNKELKNKITKEIKNSTH